MASVFFPVFLSLSLFLLKVVPKHGSFDDCVEGGAERERCPFGGPGCYCLDQHRCRSLNKNELCWSRLIICVRPNGHKSFYSVAFFCCSPYHPTKLAKPSRFFLLLDQCARRAFKQLHLTSRSANQSVN